MVNADALKVSPVVPSLVTTHEIIKQAIRATLPRYTSEEARERAEAVADTLLLLYRRIAELEDAVGRTAASLEEWAAECGDHVHGGMMDCVGELRAVLNGPEHTLSEREASE